MKKYICLKSTDSFPKCKKGKEYYGDLDQDMDIWLIDEFWIEKINIYEFDVEKHGSYVECKNKKYFKEINK